MVTVSTMHLSVPDAISSTNPRVIDDSRARKLSSDLKRCTYYETCATYGLNVERVFQDGECPPCTAPLPTQQAASTRAESSDVWARGAGLSSAFQGRCQFCAAPSGIFVRWDKSPPLASEAIPQPILCHITGLRCVRDETLLELFVHTVVTVTRGAVSSAPRFKVLIHAHLSKRFRYFMFVFEENKMKEIRVQFGQKNKNTHSDSGWGCMMFRNGLCDWVHC